MANNLHYPKIHPIYPISPSCEIFPKLLELRATVAMFWGKTQAEQAQIHNPDILL